MNLNNTVKKKLIILNNKGLHTRPAAELVKCASRYKSKISLSYRGLTVNAKSVLGILMLAATRGAALQLEIQGEDAEAALAAITHLARFKFHVRY